ncbi:MAG: carbohydrate ABC transporter permease [Proteobacteria bacterium]|nr:carbohydrate ABC transporter permease [Pseudomonadota bacterium]
MVRRHRDLLKTSGITMLAWAFVSIINIPLFWMISSSLKSPQEMLSTTPQILPSSIDLENYRTLFAGDFLTWFFNSLLVAGETTAMVIVAGTLGAYGLTRFDFRGRRPMAVVVLCTYLFPSILMLVPMFMTIASLKLSDTHLALVMANTTFALPFSLWLLRSYFLSVPVQTEEAAMIDGASRLRGFVEIVVPQITPGVISTSIFTFIIAWNEYLFASTLISTSTKRTLPVGIARYADELTPDWGILMAATVSVAIPVLMFFSFLQSRLIPEVSAGATKQ